MAAPHAAGAWALLKQAVPAAAVSEVETALKATGIRIAPACFNGSSRPRIQLDDALSYLQDPSLIQLGPSHQSELCGPATFEWAPGDNDWFLFMPYFNYAASGYDYLPGLWVATTACSLDQGWFDLLAPGGYHLWNVLGYDTGTSSVEWGDWWWFRTCAP